MCCSSTKQADLSLKSAEKGFLYAKSIDDKTWAINNGFLVARAHFLKGDVFEATEVLEECKYYALVLRRIYCMAFLEKVCTLMLYCYFY